MPTMNSKLVGYINQVNKDKVWNLGNKILYDMCRDYPEHKKANEIIAKTLIIGRVYVATLERGNSEGKEKGDRFYKHSVVKAFQTFFKKKRNQRLVKSLRKKQNLFDSVELHDRLVFHLKGLRERDKISFVSKYLHFHFPNTFYILDSRAKKSSTKIRKGAGYRKKLKA